MTARDLSARAIRQQFLEFFREKGHAVVKSSPLVPANDPTLLFTNAGMVQFKDVFTGIEKRPYTRATTAQKCMRVSGKHNDLEEVGRTARHQTFFEMLGNFSFGDYFKEEAIAFAWQLVSRDLQIDTKRLWVTVFGGSSDLPADEEAANLWRKISGLPASRIVPLGVQDNFWAMGDTGPCGPCTEIHYDMGGSGDATTRDFSTGRLVEFWNNVFMQFERHADGRLVSLPKPSVDTGMGLERLTSILQGKTSNYDTDLFRPLIEHVSARAHKAYHASDSEDDVSMRVIADHARATAFLVADGIQPSNEGRGYVMRRIMRRAIRHGRRLGFDDPFFADVCAQVVTILGDPYTELREASALISKVAETEELGFRRTLDTGLSILEDAVRETTRHDRKVLAGDVVFKLYDTYGFPVDLTELIATERGITVDHEGFARAMDAQRERSRAGHVGDAAVAGVYKALTQQLGDITFAGYPHEDLPLRERPAEWRQRDGWLELHTDVVALVVDGESVTQADGGNVEVILNPTPFYGESGGQVGDSGRLLTDGIEATIGKSKKPIGDLIVSEAQLLRGTLRVGDKVWAGYQPEVRKQTRLHHSATHLLHAALGDVLGAHVRQAGSLVDPKHLRFDFSHFEPLTPTEIRAIEDNVNTRIGRADPVETEVLPFEQAKKKGAIALFGEKYGDVVRVISMGPSVEFCGGTHAKNTADLGFFLLVHEEAIASGVRRIEAFVGDAAMTHARELAQHLHTAVQILRGACTSLDARAPSTLHALLKVAEQLYNTEALAAAREPLATLHAPTLSHAVAYAEALYVRDTWQALVKMANAKLTEMPSIVAQSTGDASLLRAVVTAHEALAAWLRQENAQQSEHLQEQAQSLLDQVKIIKNVRVLATSVVGADGKSLREVADFVRQKLGSGVICLGADTGGKAALLIAVSKDLTDTFSAFGLISEISPIVEGRGGGKPELAQAGGKNPRALPHAYEKLEQLIAAR